jgi:hypothetical protein
MAIYQRLITAVVRQFGHPRGIGGHLAGWVMPYRGRQDPGGGRDAAPGQPGRQHPALNGPLAPIGQALGQTRISMLSRYFNVVEVSAHRRTS